MAHDCVIGIVHLCDGYDFVTLPELKNHIQSKKEQAKLWKCYGFPDEQCPCTWDMKDYTDFRKNTDLHRFMFCPVCGKKICWNQIRRVNDG